jgi:hypothetical protein
MGVVSLASAAMIISSMLSSEMVPCSQSIKTQSNPNLPIISTTWGDGIITDTPNAGWPDSNPSFILFFFIPHCSRRFSIKVLVQK